MLRRVFGQRFSPGDIREEVLRSAYDYWEKLRKDAVAPARADIDPVDVPNLLPQLALMDIERNPDRVKIKLAGTRVVEWFGRDATGMYLDSPEYGHIGKARQQYILKVANRVRPAYDASYAPHHDKHYRHYSRLLLPFLGRDGTVCTVMGAYELLPTPDTER